VDGSAVVQKLAFKHEQQKQTRKVVDLSHQLFLLFFSKFIPHSCAFTFQWAFYCFCLKFTAHFCAFLEVSSEQSSNPFSVKNILFDFVPYLLNFLRIYSVFTF